MTTSAIAPDRGSIIPRRLHSEIVRGLYMGGTRDDDVLGIGATWRRQEGRVVLDVEARATIGRQDFAAVVTLYPLARPVGLYVQEYRWGLLDDREVDFDPDLDALHDVVNWAHRQWLRDPEEKVLIRCQAGLNRSGVVTALVLMRDGYTADEAITLIRRRRSDKALFNEKFEQWLRAQDPEDWR